MKSIDSDKLKETMIHYGFRAPDMTVTEFVEDVLVIIEAEPIKHGHWIWDKCADMGGAPKCSVCGRRSHSGAWNGENHYCPVCGAKMEGNE